MLLVLDGPTAHLDMEAVVWFEEYLKTFNKILLMVSHSQDFMNAVCTQVILLRHQTLTYYSGNYATYLKVREEKSIQQQRDFDHEQGLFFVAPHSCSNFTVLLTHSSK